MVWHRQFLENSAQMDEQFNYKGVYRTAPATSGLLKKTASLNKYI